MLKNRRNLSLAVLATTSMLIVASSAYSQVDYVGPNAGDWGTLANWSTNAVPTAADNVVVDARAGNFSVLTGNDSTRAANNLTVNTGDAVELSNNSTFNLGGNLAGGGTVRFNVPSSRAYLNFSSPTATIGATDTIDFNYQGGSAPDGLISGPASGTLTNNGLIRGSGTLGNIRFTNSASGVLENYQTTAQLFLDSNNSDAGLFVNKGIIRALAGSLVTFAGDAGGDFINSSGQIQANGAGAIVRLTGGASITGGSYSTSSGGQIVVEAGSNVTANNFSNAGTFVLRNNSQLNISGTITNTGTIDFTQPYTSESNLYLAGDTTLTGAAGVIQMDYSNTSGSPAGVITGPGKLTIGSGQTIRGVGALRNVTVSNSGLIDANNGSAGAAVGAGLTLDSSNVGAGLFVNTGTIRSSAGGYLIFAGDAGGDYINTNGTIAAIGTGSITELRSGATITGGKFTSSGGGLIRIRPNDTATLVGPITFTSGTKFSVLASPGNTTYLYANGVFTNTGSTLELNANGQLSLLSLTGDLTINGGTISAPYTNVSNSPGARIDTGSNTLTLSSTTTTQGVVFFNNARVISNGIINANDPAGVRVDPSNQGGDTDLFINNGLMEATAGGLMTLVGDAGGGLNNTSGTIVATGTGSTVELQSGMRVTGGTLTTAAGGVMRIRPNDTATLVGPITFTSGTKFSVLASPGNTTYLYANGVFTNTGSTLELNANGQLSLLSLTGDLTINGGTISAPYTNVSNSPGARIDTGSNTLTLSSTTTTQGVVFFNNARVISNGIINANDPAGVRVDPSNQGGDTDLFINNGLMEATAGGLMTLVGDAGGGLNNTSGTIVATGTGSTVELQSGMRVTGGTLTTAAGGVMRIRPNDTATLVGPITFTSGTKFQVPTTPTQTTYLYTSGVFANNGTIELNSNGSLALLSLVGDTTLTGTGILSGVYAGTGAGPRIDTGASTLTIGTNQTVAGIVDFNNDRVTNNGTLLANAHAVPTGVGQFDMYLDANNQTGTPLFINNGTIHATNSAAIGIGGDAGGPYAGTGPLIVDAGAVIGSWNSAAGDLGPVSGAGTYRAAGNSNLGQQSFRVGTLEALSGATARITAGGGNAGTSKVTTLTIDTAAGSRLDVTDHGVIIDYTGASPAAAIRALLTSGRNNGTWNGIGIDSSLANANGKAVGYGEASALSGAPTSFLGQPVDSTSVVVRYTFLGDANLDGLVDFNDLVSLAQNYGSATNITWMKGDFNYDGNVDFNDLVPLAQNYGKALTAAQVTELGSGFASDFALAQSVAPEPTSLLAGVGLLTASAVRRRRAC